jgi:hypothetical protein
MTSKGNIVMLSPDITSTPATAIDAVVKAGVLAK